ncbi:hypothetical protein LSAT2_001024, partial [Lamellibrachia satsuma]
MDKKGTSGVGFAVPKRFIENIIEPSKTISDSLSPTATSVYPTSGFTPLKLYGDVYITRALRGADFSTDHHLIRCSFKMDMYVTQRRKAANPKRRLNVAKLHTTTGRANLRNSME